MNCTVNINYEEYLIFGPYGGHAPQVKNLDRKPSFQHVVLWNRTNGCLLPLESRAIEAWSFLDGFLFWGSCSICSIVSFAMVPFPLPLQPVMHITGSPCFIFSPASVLVGLMSWDCSSTLGPVPHHLSFPSFWTGASPSTQRHTPIPIPIHKIIWFDLNILFVQLNSNAARFIQV